MKRGRNSAEHTHLLQLRQVEVLEVRGRVHRVQQRRRLRQNNSQPSSLASELDRTRARVAHRHTHIRTSPRHRCAARTGANHT